MTQPRLRRLFYPALMFLIIILFYWKITLTYQYDWVRGPDLAQQMLPWFEEESRQVHHSRFPLWDPHASVGQPLIGLAQPGAAYPVNWLLFLAPRTKSHIDTAVLQWYFVVIHYMAALFCYLLCRDLGLSRFASLTGGLIFALGAYVGTALWPQMINAAVWAPLVFMFLLRSLRSFRPLASAALCGVFWGMSWLSGDYEVPLFISLAAWMTWIFYAVQSRSWNIAGLAAVASVFMFFTAALQFLPAAEYTKLSGANDVPYSVQRAFSMSPLTAFGIIIPGMIDFAYPFIGIVAFTLVLASIVVSWNRPEVRLFTALAAGGFAYALGAHNIFQGILYSVVPFVEKARSPAMSLVIFGLGAAVLAAFGVDQLPALRESHWGRRMAWALTAFGLLIWTVAFCILVGKAFAWTGSDMSIFTAFVAVLAGGLLFAWLKHHVTTRVAGALLIGLILLELGNVSGANFADRNNYAQSSWLQKIRSNGDIADFLSGRPHPFRVAMDTDELGLNWPEYNNISEIKSDPARRSLLDVQYIVGRNTTMPDAAEVFEGASGLKVFQNPHAFPRAWTVHELVRHQVDDPRSAAFLTQPFAQLPPVTPCPSPDWVGFTRDQPANITLRANMICDGMVVLSDTFYPGWKASVDQKPVRTYQVNSTMRGVLVPRGSHEVKYVYRPASVYTGAAMTASSLLVACLLVFFAHRRHVAIDLGGESRNNQK